MGSHHIPAGACRARSCRAAARGRQQRRRADTIRRIRASRQRPRPLPGPTGHQENRHGQSRSGCQDHPRTLAVPVRAARPAPRLPPAGDRRAPRDRPALPRTGGRHHRGVRHPLAGQRRLPHQLRAALRGALHQQRVAALHRQHGVRLPRQPGAGPHPRRGLQRARRGDPGPRRHHPRPGVRHPGTDALHEPGPPLQGGLGLRPVHRALPERQRAPGLGHAQGGGRALRRHGGVPRQRLAVPPLRPERPGAGLLRPHLEPVPRGSRS